MALNPLSRYAAWSPRQIAGSNPFYDQLFGAAQSAGPAVNSLNLLFGGTSPAQGGMAVPNMGGSGGSSGGGGGATTTGLGSDLITPAPPPQFQAANINDIINQQVTGAVQQQVASNPTLQGAYYGRAQSLAQWAMPQSLGLGDPAFANMPPQAIVATVLVNQGVPNDQAWQAANAAQYPGPYAYIQSGVGLDDPMWRYPG